ncbi:hypothetical protein AK812_SmicGene31548 [Symbiodinium microadriaticum]|uniref:Uncharacterized protein n=1 Tax=Symbiodinium microadriaticum TaxID=2951 RepID=A0A1Q9CWD3_SYMMI|nr:hypothetical protein AK812_SmicGene31548 [Symbiodinium microadriaticum]
MPNCLRFKLGTRLGDPPTELRFSGADQMYGLRLINNNYVANGTGKDVTIVYDPSFRGGRLGSVNQMQHFPNPKAGPVKLRKLPDTGLDARDEGYKQILNCGRSAGVVVKEAKAKINEGRKFRFRTDANQTLGTVMALQSLPASRELIRASSAPSLSLPSPGPNSHFRTRWQMPASLLDNGNAEAATADCEEAKMEKKSLLPTYWRPKDPALDWPAPGFLHPVHGFSRTDGGMPWPN